MNGTTFNRTAKLIGLFAGAVGGLAGGFIYAVWQLCTKEDLKEAEDEITWRIESVEKRIDNHNNDMSKRIDGVNGNIIQFIGRAKLSDGRANALPCPPLAMPMYVCIHSCL